MIITGVTLRNVGFVSDTPPIVTAGLYANYDPATSISGSTLADSSGNGFDATLFNSPTTATVNGKTVLQLTAASSQYYGYVGGSGYGSDLNNAFTFDVWARNLSANTPGVLIAEWGEWDNPGYNYGGWTDNQMGFTNGTINMGLYNTGYVTGPGWSSSNWYHIVMCYDVNVSPTLNTYVNGVFAGSTDGGKGNPGTTFLSMGFPGNDYIGINGYPYFNGYVGAWKIYNRALTANEVTQNFAALRGRYRA
jgi:hypothetical protein